MDRFGLLCRNIYEKKRVTQRELAAAMDLSLGTCNHLIRDALADGLIALDPQTGEYSLLKKGVELLQKYRVNAACIGRDMTVLCEHRARSGMCSGRTYADSPEIDGTVYFTGAAQPGDMVTVHITGCDDGDLAGEQIHE